MVEKAKKERIKLSQGKTYDGYPDRWAIWDFYVLPVVTT
jgi:hypothetical protein